jgi:hypothetical protein
MASASVVISIYQNYKIAFKLRSEIKKTFFRSLQGRDSVQCVTTTKSFLPIGILYNIT